MKKYTFCVALGMLVSGLWQTPAFAVSIAPETKIDSLPSFADLVEKLMPSVVNISTTTKLNPDNLESEEDILEGAAPEFRRFFENGKKQEALGSGFIIDKDGYIITNAHVVHDAESVHVTLYDDTVLDAKIIGKDTKTDIALIKIDTNKNLQPVKFGDSDKSRVGDWVLAIGNPFGLGGSVTAGIISAKSRDIESGQYDNFIQTDASINQGSSGGPMFNMQGEVIGINSVFFSTNGASMGIGFAIPINLADWVVAQLKKYGTIKRGWIGLRIQPNTPETAQDMGLMTTKGVIVSDVNHQGPARQAGLEAGDVILSFNGEEISSTKDFSARVAEAKIGSTAKLEIFKDGQKKTVSVKIELLQDETEAEKKHTSPEAKVEQLAKNEFLVKELGLKLAEITPETRLFYNLPSHAKGLIITAILPKSDGLTKGLSVGDVIVKIDKKDVFDIQSLTNCITEAKMEHNRPVLLFIQNGDDVHFAALKLLNGE